MSPRFTDDDALPLPAVFEVLADDVRFRLLLHATSSTDRHHVDDLARAVDPGGDRSGPLAVRLHHQHLPMLSASGVVDWRREEGWVRRGRAFPAVDRVLDAIVGYDGRLTHGRSDVN